MWNEGIVFVISAPAGTGKSSLVDKLKTERAEVIQSISYTSRAPRGLEEDGIHYHFITKKQFEEKIESGDLLEYVQLYGTYYGTSRSWVKARLEEKKMVVLVIDTQGARALQNTASLHQLPIVYLFIKPPSIEALRARLMKRASENEAEIQMRLSEAIRELSQEKFYDYSFVNDDFDDAYEVLRSIVVAEEHKIIPK